MDPLGADASTPLAPLGCPAGRRLNLDHADKRDRRVLRPRCFVRKPDDEQFLVTAKLLYLFVITYVRIRNSSHSPRFLQHVVPASKMAGDETIERPAEISEGLKGPPAPVDPAAVAGLKEE